MWSSSQSTRNIAVKWSGTLQTSVSGENVFIIPKDKCLVYLLLHAHEWLFFSDCKCIGE